MMGSDENQKLPIRPLAFDRKHFDLKAFHQSESRDRRSNLLTRRMKIACDCALYFIMKRSSDSVDEDYKAKSFIWCCLS